MFALAILLQLANSASGKESGEVARAGVDGF
jgi:hypothetical protein